MASFDVRIPVAPTERSFAHALLAYLQRLALLRQYSRPTVVRFRWSKPTSNAEYHHYHVYVDGDFAELQAFCFDSSGALFHYGEGLLSAKRHKIRESLVHQVVCLAFAKAMFEFNEDIVDLTTQMHAAGSRIVLISGSRLVNLMIDHGIGVTTIASYEVKRIDSDYFEES